MNHHIESPPAAGEFNRWASHMRIGISLSLALLVAACATKDQKVLQVLLGCWTASEVETYREDGTRSTTYGECSRFYADRQVFVTCVGPSANQLSTINFEYKLESPNSYMQYMIGSSHAANVATYSKPHEFLINEDTLSVVSYPVAISKTPGRTVVKMVARFMRAGIKVHHPSQCRPSKSP